MIRIPLFRPDWEKLLQSWKPLVTEIRKKAAGIRDETQLRRLAHNFSSQATVNRQERIISAYSLVLAACHACMGKTYTLLGKKTQWDMIPYDEQILAAVALAHRTVIEMPTGEGKTLVGVFPAFLHAQEKPGNFIVTANDYLARRDAEWMGVLYEMLGITVGCTSTQGEQAYQCDVVYTTARCLAVDHLNEQISDTITIPKLRGRSHFALVDEADAVLIDEARVPTILGRDEEIPAEVVQKGQELNQTALRLIQAQAELCEATQQKLLRLLPQVAKLDALGRAEVGRALLRLQLGAPTHSLLLQCLQDPKLAQLLQTYRQRLTGDIGELDTLKEELYFSIDEKKKETRLSRKGCQLACPENPASLTPSYAAERLIDVQEFKGTPAEHATFRDNVEREIQESQFRAFLLRQLLTAHCSFRKDVDYAVVNAQVILIDPNTHRLLPNRRLAALGHTALEIKEGVPIQPENSIVGMTTLQRLFRQFTHLGAMTGTAVAEADNFKRNYNLEVVVIPTHKPCLRVRMPDAGFKTKAAKLAALLRDIKWRHAKGQPILISTPSVLASEELSQKLRQQGIEHNLLNAKNPEQEAAILANAGQKHAITLTTRMAGRGTDIKLGEGVIQLGGLHIIGTEHFENPRYDEQLAGRCARQGDPGSVQFFLSFEDDLLRLFSSETIVRILSALGLQENDQIQSRWLGKVVREAQMKVMAVASEEQQRVEALDLTISGQQDAFYDFRNQTLEGDNLEQVKCWLRDWLQAIHEQQLPVTTVVQSTFGVSIQEGTITEVANQIQQAYLARRNPDDERKIILTELDRLWFLHLQFLQNLQTIESPIQEGEINPVFMKRVTEQFESLQSKTPEIGVKAIALALRKSVSS